MSSETSQFPRPDLQRVTALINSDTKERCPVANEKVTIGRDRDNSLRLEDDTFVSGHHAQVYFEKGETWLRDLGSRNGTLVNNVNVTGAVKIRPGDTVVIGQTRFQVE